MANLDRYNTTLAFTAEDLTGIPSASIATSAATPEGNYRVTTKHPDYVTVP